MSLSTWWKRVRSRTVHEEEPLMRGSDSSINDGGQERSVSSAMRHALKSESELQSLESRHDGDGGLNQEGWTRRNWASRIPYYIPILTWLPEYDWKTNIIKDVVAGTAVAMMLVPQSLAYASIAGLQPIYGLYTSWLPLIIYAILGTSKQLSVGPDILGSLLVGLVVTALPPPTDPSDSSAAAAAALAHFLSLMVGLLVFLLGLFRVGFIDNVLSRPLLSGFINALALYIITEQADVFLGMPAVQNLHGWHKLPYVLDHLDKVNFIAFGMGLASVFFMLVFRILRRYVSQKSAIGKVLKYIPEIMIVVVVTTMLTYFFRLSEAPHNVIVLNNIEGGFPVPLLPPFNLPLIRQYLPNAITIGLLGFVESIVVAKLYARKNNYLISANRDLVALGAANIFGSFFRTYPTFGSLPRSFIANMYGATSQMFGLIASCWILLTLMALRHLFWYLPKVAMSAIVISAAVSLIEFDQIIFLVHLRAWQEILLATLTFTLTYVLGVDLGILLSLTISVFLVIRHSSLPHMSILGRTPEGRYRDVTQHKNASLIPGVLLVSIDEGLYFANIEHIKQMFLRVERLGSIGAHPSQKNRSVSIYAMIINAKNISEIDAGAAEILTEMKKDWESRGICCCFVKLRPAVRDLLIRAGMLKSENDPFLFKNMDDAVSRFVASLD